jgi:hypothetical protein
MISLVLDMLLAITLAGLESSILVDANSTVNEAKQDVGFALKGGERDCDGSHNRAARQALAMRGIQAGELAGNRQGKEMVAEELPH